jgi:DMSO/TMAO reductase YedYZ molybdopterin-dependent catalytic subunit
MINSKKPSPLELGRMAVRGIASMLFDKSGNNPRGTEIVEMDTTSTRPDVISLDTKRDRRIPPGQIETKRWPVLHAGPTPNVDTARWNLKIWGLVEEPKSFTWEDFKQLPVSCVFADMHCVTTWSMLNNLWEGVLVRDVLKHVRVKPEATHVLVHAENSFTTNLSLKDFSDEDCLFAWAHNGRPLSADHGWPLRLVVPKLYAWKSAKWVNGLEFLARDRPGFWERNGYHNHGDPWTEERYW